MDLRKLRLLRPLKLALGVEGLRDQNMDPIAFIFILALILLVCLFIWGTGMFVQKRIAERHPNNNAVKKLSIVEVVFGSFIGIFTIIVLLVRKLDPDSFFGSLFNNWYDWIFLFLALYVYGAVGGLVKFFWLRKKQRQYGDKA